MQVSSQYQPIFRELGIDADTIFTHELIKPWRTLEDRENCTLETTLRDGRTIRWHIKRYPPSRRFALPANIEAGGHRALEAQQIPTATLIGYGTLPDRRGFIIFEDLAGYDAADKLIESGTPFETLLEPTADLVAKLHGAGLHHRDLYLCHFFAKVSGGSVDVKLIDPARVRRLPRLFAPNRWIVKDLAQFWYSGTKLPVTDEQRTRWLARYAQQRGIEATASLRRCIERKVAWIGKHDAVLRKRQPHRNISIPSS
jgi:lipopolysaccharide kinase (Kdo/WaaP) family protein